MKVEVNCPCVICGGVRSVRLHEIDYPEYGYPGRFSVRQCLGCGLLFNSPRLDDAAIAALYDGNYYVFQEREPQAVRRVASLLNCTVGVAQALTPHRRVLEVGCAKGWLLAMLRSQGWTVEGVELSSAAADHARRKLGLTVFTGTLEDYVKAGHEPHPMVVSTDVIEHVPDLDAFAAALAQAVAPDGLLVVGTPNADSAARHLHGPQWLGFNPFHIYLLSRSTLSALLARHGFEVVESYTYNNNDEAIGMRPAGGMKAAVKAGLDASGVLPALRSARDAVGHALDGWLRPTPQLLAAAAARLPQQVPFMQSDDGRAERRARCEGDNLVVIARRSGASA